MLTKLAALVLAAALPVAALAQEARESVLTVTGQGIVEMAPDMAVISLGVTTEAETAAEALRLNNEQQSAVLAALTAAGVEARDVQTSGLSLNPVWDNRYDNNGQPRISGYQASNVVTVRVRQLDRLGELLDDVVTTGANTLNSLSFGLEDDREAKDEARRRAVADARARAELYAGAAGVTLGPILTLSEAGDYQPPQPMFRREAAMDSGVPVAGGELSIAASVTITYVIE